MFEKSAMALWSGVTVVLLAVQAGEGSVTGIVTDGETGAPLAGATVSLVDLDRVSLTNAEGRYLLSQVPPGPRQVLVGRVRYEPRIFQALVPPQGTLEINVALSPEPITLQTIEVRAAIPVTGLDQVGRQAAYASYPDRGLSLEAVRRHPLLAEPDVLQATAGGEVALDPESPSGLHVRGGASDQVAYVIDGIPVFSPYHTAGTFSAWNPDALSRIDLLASSPSPAAPDALSGVFAATTLAPGPQHRTQGGVSTTQARATLDGPIGGGSGYLLSLRSTFPGLMFREREPSHLSGESQDWLAKLEVPVAGGSLRMLGYGSSNEIGSARVANLESPAGPIPQNDFDWTSRSIGAGWSGPLRGATVHLRAWSATSDAGAHWSRPDSTPARLAAGRDDAGLLAVVELSGSGRMTTAGIRAQRSQTFYRFRSVTDPKVASSFQVETPIAAAFIRQQARVTPSSEVELTLVSSLAAGAVHLGPSANFRWWPAERWSLTAGYARRHQFAQSLRNPESVVGTVFPVDLYVGSGRGGVPVARSDLGIAALEFRPTTAIRLGVQAYARSFGSLALVAPRTAEPFATSGFVTGAGNAYGVALEAGTTGARYGVVGSYALQRVRLEYGDTSYVPGHGVTHSIDLGFIVLPSRTSEVRLGLSGLIGRRTTAVDGALEWQSCNLLDKGCEFAGSPGQRSEPLGATSLPGYLRVDVGFRKHWPLAVAGRQGVVALFGTVTNLLGRRNLLTFAVDPTTGGRSPIEMRPLSPLVVGFDWRF
jgi:Carboxypeptidase regulatory-like domain/TonB-dependent Receptor Plug Domain